MFFVSSAVWHYRSSWPFQQFVSSHRFRGPVTYALGFGAKIPQTYFIIGELFFFPSQIFSINIRLSFPRQGQTLFYTEATFSISDANISIHRSLEHRRSRQFSDEEVVESWQEISTVVMCIQNASVWSVMPKSGRHTDGGKFDQRATGLLASTKRTLFRNPSPSVESRDTTIRERKSSRRTRMASPANFR